MVAVKQSKWMGWFRPVSRSSVELPLLVTKIELSNRKRDVQFVVSVPKKCGSAVQRNRFRRVIKEQLRDLLQSETRQGKMRDPLWIRLNKNYQLPRNIRGSLYQKQIKKIIQTYGL